MKQSGVNNKLITMKKMHLFYLIMLVFVLASCGSSSSEDSEEEYAIEGQTADGFEDGTYCADVTYYNPNTGTSNDYTLEVEVSSNEVTQINWGNGGWMDEDHFYSQELDSEGSCSFTSDKEYDYTVKITGKNCGNLDSEDKYSSKNLPKYSYEEATQMLGMTNEEKADCNIYSEGDVLSENDLFILKSDLISIRQYLNALKGYSYSTDNEQGKIQNTKNEINEGYVQNIERRSAYGVTSQVVTIKKRGINYTFEVRGSEKCTMGTATFDENATGWQMVYIKQYPDVDHWSGYSMRIIN
jgi:hypothetical protein